MITKSKTLVTKEPPFKICWRCFGCGMRWKSRRALYGHLQHCYWFNQFKDNIEAAPFFKKIPSRQLRFYWRNKKRINLKRKSKYAEESKKKRKLPRSLRH